MISIDKRIPLPDRSTKYPWREMEIGDSFCCNTEVIRSGAVSAGKRYGLKFTVKKEGDHFRVWRIK